jgi:hypothetical protein
MGSSLLAFVLTSVVVCGDGDSEYNRTADLVRAGLVENAATPELPTKSNRRDKLRFIIIVVDRILKFCLTAMYFESRPFQPCSFKGTNE